jgi:hypothetical protein
MLIRAATRLAETKCHPGALSAARGLAALRQATRHSPEAVERLLCSPLVNAWVLHTVARLNQDDLDGADPGRLADLVAPVVSSNDPGTPRIRVECGESTIDLLLATLDPRHFPGVHIDETAWSDPATVRVWHERIAAGWRLLVRGHPATATEIGLIMSTLAALVPPSHGYTSGTFRHAFGLVAMSLPPDVRAAAVALAHEVQHAKLAALMDLFPLAEAGCEDRYYAPWRPDPRPLGALLHGTYAHLGVANFWRTQQRHEADPVERLRAQVEFARWREAVTVTVRTILDSGRLTPIGVQFVTAMDSRLKLWRREPVCAQADAEARRLLREHRARWQGA